MGKELLVDPVISRNKFNVEVDEVLHEQKFLRKERGCIIEKVEFPIARATFITPHLKPKMVLCTLELDFTNYDIEPPAAKLLEPGTLEPLKNNQITANYIKQGVLYKAVVDSHPITAQPFLCWTGIREYHSHPSHSGDFWFLHRQTNLGSLRYILELVYDLCIKPIKSVHYLVQVTSDGYLLDEKCLKKC